MQVIIFVATACLLASASAAPTDEKMIGSSYGGGSSYSAPAAPAYSAPAAPAYSAPAAPAYSAPAAPAYSAPAAPAHSAPAYSAPASISAPPCPRNYLFSCQPNLAPVPCSAPAASSGSSYGSAGAYSQNYPLYAPLPIQW